MPISEQTYEQAALEEPNGLWELVCGRLRKKPGMTTEPYDVVRRLVRRLNAQLDKREYVVGMENPKLRTSTGTYFMPDVCVIPRSSIEHRRAEMPHRFEMYEEPMPLVVEVWSPSTGDYDVENKLREYQQRRDQEVWRIHPYEQTLTIWRLQPDGSYVASLVTAGSIHPTSLPNVPIDLAGLFD